LNIEVHNFNGHVDRVKIKSRCVLKTSIAAAASLDKSQAPFTLREANKMVQIFATHRSNSKPYLSSRIDNTKQVVERVIRTSTVSHPRACILAFYRVFDELS
jgi:hypothetical protein